MYALVRYSCSTALLINFLFFLMIRRPPGSTRTDTLFPARRSSDLGPGHRPGNRRRLVLRRARRRAGSRSGDRLYGDAGDLRPCGGRRSEEHTSELQSLMRISYAVFCLKKKNTKSISYTNLQQLT